MTKPPEFYVSVDIETDGPCPGFNSMLSLGAVALDPSRGLDEVAVVSTFSVNLDALPPPAAPDPDTMAWWKTQPKAWAAHRVCPRSPEEAIPLFIAWLEGSMKDGHKPIFIGYPASFDFTFVYYYLHRFGRGKNPFVRNAVDIETFVMGLTGRPYLQCDSDTWPERWKTSLPHSHVALDDAKEQGFSFLRILAEARARAGLRAYSPWEDR